MYDEPLAIGEAGGPAHHEVNYDSFDDLLFLDTVSASNTGPAAGSAFPSLSATEDIFSTFESLLHQQSHTSTEVTEHDSTVGGGQASLSCAAPTPSYATASTSPAHDALSTSQACHDDDDRFFIKQQQELSDLSVSPALLSDESNLVFPQMAWPDMCLGPTLDNTPYMPSSSLEQDTVAPFTNSFSFGLPLMDLCGPSLFASSVVA